MIWAYLIHLGQNLWKESVGDPGSLSNYSHKMITEDKAWRRITAFIAENGFNTLVIDLAEGICYKSHPELSVEGAWNRERLKTELQRLRDMGITPIPKLNFASAHDAWLKEYSRMLSTPPYYRVVRELIDEVSELFEGPEYFHLGMDEECFAFIDYQAKYGHTCIRQGQALWQDISYMCECVRDNGSRPWLWNSSFWYNTQEAVKELPKDILLSGGLYDRLLNPEQFILFQKPAMDSCCKFAEAGFEQVVVCATYNTSLNPDDAMHLFKNVKNIKGYFTAPWYRTRETDVLKHFAEAKVFKCAREKYFNR